LIRRKREKFAVATFYNGSKLFFDCYKVVRKKWIEGKKVEVASSRENGQLVGKTREVY